MGHSSGPRPRRYASRGRERAASMRDLHSMTVDSHHHGRPPERPSRGGSRWACPTDSPYWATTSCRVSIAPDPSRATKSVGSPAFSAIRFPAARRNTSLLHSGEHVREFGVGHGLPQMRHARTVCPPRAAWRLLPAARLATPPAGRLADRAACVPCACTVRRYSLAWRFCSGVFRAAASTRLRLSDRDESASPRAMPWRSR